MNRNEFQDLALTRLEEAQILLKNRKYDGAYYLCGYSIECGLKACIAKQTKRYDFPDKNVVNESYTHNLTKLLKAAGLENRLNDFTKENKKLNSNWAVVKDWTELSRYKKVSEKKAKDLYDAVANKRNGVLQWIKQNW